MTGWPGVIAPPLAVLALSAVLLALTASNPYLLNLATIIAIYGILSLGLGILVGLTGQMSMGHGALFGVGAYVTAYGVAAGLGFWPALLLAMAAAALCGLLMGVVSLRFEGIYFAIVTFAFSSVVVSVLQNWRGVTGGANGLSANFDPPPLRVGPLDLAFDAPPAFFALLALALTATVLLVAALKRSRFGRACVAIREDEVLARCLGVSAFGHKLAAFVVSSAIAGLAGGWYATYLKYITPELFTVMVSIEMIMALIIGGLLSPIVGPLIGSAVFVLLPEILRFAEGFRAIVFGAVAIAIVLVVPGGIAGALRPLVRSALGRLRPASPSLAPRLSAGEERR